MSGTTTKIGMKIGANCCDESGMRGMQTCARDATSRQTIEGERVAASPPDGDSRKARNSPGVDCANPSAGNHMQTSGAGVGNSPLRNLLGANRLRGFPAHADRGKEAKTENNSTRMSTLVRWCKFNFVGAVGIFVQFGALFFLKSVLHFHYLAATALAVEVAVVHNFLWHERYTWADYTWADRVKRSWKKSLARFLRFNLSNGLVSIAGNLGMMRMMVGWGHMNYLAANGIAILVCSLVNFVVSDGWVFGEGKTSSPRIDADSRGFKN